MKRGWLIASILTLIFTTGLLWYLRHLYLVRVQLERAEQARRNAVYAVLLHQYQDNLHIGMTRNEVQNYLDSNHLQYAVGGFYSGGEPQNYQIKIAEEPGGGFVCDRWFVYIALNFAAAARAPAQTWLNIEVAPSPSDKLKDIRIAKMGHCL